MRHAARVEPAAGRLARLDGAAGSAPRNSGDPTPDKNGLLSTIPPGVSGIYDKGGHLSGGVRLEASVPALHYQTEAFDPARYAGLLAGTRNGQVMVALALARLLDEYLIRHMPQFQPRPLQLNY